jgi:hypothetical protein
LERQTSPRKWNGKCSNGNNDCWLSTRRR